MMFLAPAQSLYASFDRFPSAKGASVHIERTAKTLFRRHPPGILFALGRPGLPLTVQEETHQIRRVIPKGMNVIDRALDFGRKLTLLLEQHGDRLQLVQFRDPWSGIPILLHGRGRFRSVYEVNGLPSIELPSAFPWVGKETLAKIRAAEAFCWNQADRIVTPSHTLRENLIGLGVPPEKITVVSNGADLNTTPPRPADAPPAYLLYFGALQRWQGVDTLLRAFLRLKDWPDLRLVICSSVPARGAKPYQKLASTLGLTDRILWRFCLDQKDLAPWRAHALLSVAPLADCARNVEQGCCPLKILESMADGVPVVASDLPSVRELVTDGIDGRLVPPDRPAELARAIRVLLEFPDQRQSLGCSARNRVARDFTWSRVDSLLEEVYAKLMSPSESTGERRNGSANSIEPAEDPLRII